MIGYDPGGLEALRIAIVKKAVDDYREVFRKRLRGKKITITQEKEFDDAERFFDEYCSTLTDIDGDYFIERIHKEERENRRKEINR